MYMYNRNDLIFGIIFIAVGIIVFISVLWVEPITNPEEFPPWFYLTFRIIALICVVVGTVGIISALIPKKEQETVSDRKCPKCRRDIPFNAVVCPYCQYDFK